MWRQIKRSINMATIIVLLGSIIALSYLFSYLVPVTDDAFVVNNISPVAATVDGYITQIYVHNGQWVPSGYPIISIFPDIYQADYRTTISRYLAALQDIQVLIATTDKNRDLLKATQEKLAKARYEYNLKSDKRVASAVSHLEVVELDYDVETLQNEANSLQEQLKLDEAQITMQQHAADALKAQVDRAKTNVEQTTIYALESGYVQNFYVGLRTPVKAQMPLFSFVASDNTYIQANFYETDLRNVVAGDKVLIFPRMYLGRKVFHGIVTDDYWGVSRQNTDSRTQLQHVQSENEWLLLPQRLPVQIKVLDNSLTGRELLRSGMSAYVYIQTK